MLWLVKNALSAKMSHFSFQSSVDPQHIQNIDAVRRSMKTPSRVRFEIGPHSWVKVFRIVREFRILRLTYCEKSASKC